MSCLGSAPTVGDLKLPDDHCRIPGGEHTRGKITFDDQSGRHHRVVKAAHRSVAFIRGCVPFLGSGYHWQPLPKAPLETYSGRIRLVTKGTREQAILRRWLPFWLPSA
jgi:hypothetical protein